MKSILAVDTINVAFSSYFGKPLINPYGINVNAIKGFFIKLRNALEVFNPDYVVFADDVPRQENFRRRMYPEYKAQRKPTPPDVFDQILYIKSLIYKLGFPLFRYSPYEADDILGMIHSWGDENEFETIIMSSDKDLYQLVSDRTSICPPRADQEFIDREYIFKTYRLLPYQWIELKILQGDSSDNLPGIKGIGHQTALGLIQRYETVDNVYSHINELSQSLQKKLLDGQKNLNIMRKLMTIVTDYTQIDLQEEMFIRGDVQATSIMKILGELSIKSLESIMWYDLIPYQKRSENNGSSNNRIQIS